ncbi:MAG: hypothetical protein IJD51_00020 [Clostridia bacterium]|nr:hypothetical protein [Clostridia bacterium]
MPNLFLIDGVPGSGKSELINHCSRAWKTVFIKKYTTKKVDTDGLVRGDLVYVGDNEFEEKITRDDFVYSYPKRSAVRYMISKSELDAALRANDNVFVVVRSSEVIKKIKKTYARFVNVNVVSIFVYCDNEKLKSRMRTQLREAKPDIDEDELEEKVSSRADRNAECVESYIESLRQDDVYDFVIINDLQQERYYDCIDQIVSKYDERERASKKMTVFVIMPMPSKHEAAHFYNVKEAIYEGARQVGFDALRADDDFLQQKPIFSKIKEYIDEATVCIVDLTNNRPNCYFEAGLAYEKKTANIPTAFLIAEQGTAVEFDLNGNDRKEYTYTFNDYSNVTNVVKSILLSFKEEHVF